MTRGWFVVITLPISGFISVVCFAVCGFSGDRIQIAPGLPFCLVKLSFFLLGKFLIRDEFFHNVPPNSCCLNSNIAE